MTVSIQACGCIYVRIFVCVGLRESSYSKWRWESLKEKKNFPTPPYSSIDVDVKIHTLLITLSLYAYR